jgi:hypothetical protein
MFGIFLFLTYYLQQTLGYPPLVTGIAFLPGSGSLIVIALPPSGRSWHPSRPHENCAQGLGCLSH